jgi:hypothetical protein
MPALALTWFFALAPRRSPRISRLWLTMIGPLVLGASGLTLFSF